VLDSYFSLTNKSNFIDRLQYHLIRFFDHLVVAYSFGPLCTFANLQSLPRTDISSDFRPLPHGVQPAYFPMHLHNRVCFLIFPCEKSPI